MLLLIDSLHDNWESGACSNWETSNSNCEKRNQGKFAMHRLNNPIFGSIEKETVQANDCNIDEFEVRNKWIARKMSIEIFQGKLIEHFDMQLKRNAIKWPIRCKLNQLFN